MTMIACTMNKSAPVLIGDLLISDTFKPNQFIIPILNEDVFQYLSSTSEYHPIQLYQKIYILKPNVCIAFAGKVFYIKQFLEDISIFCRINDTIDSEKMNEFLASHKDDDSWPQFSFLIFVIEKKEDHFGVGRFIHGDWFTTKTDLFEQVFAAGSGSVEFLREIVKDANIRSEYPSDNINYTLQVNIAMIARLFAHERLTLESVKQHWGAGFEMIYFDGNHFTKLDNITYIINQGLFNENGDIPQVPIPAIILHYTYFGEVLIITVIRPHSGMTKTTDETYEISYNEFEIAQFEVMPVNYQYHENLGQPTQDPSFTNNRIAMGYIIETKNGHYLPASFNTGPGIKVQYKHPSYLNISMYKVINDMLTSEAKSVFPNLP